MITLDAGPIQLLLLVIAVSVLIVMLHRQRRRQQTAHWAVYLLDERTDRYGSPIAVNLTNKEAWKFAKEWADECYPQGYREGGNGYQRAGRPGAGSLNVLVWDMNWRRD